MPRSFQALLTWLYDWLSGADPIRNADLIFTLAGRQSRKVFALGLFEQGRAPRLLLSVGRFEIRRFAKLRLPANVNLLEIATPVFPPERHFFVIFENHKVEVEWVPRRRLGTLSEIRALATWLRGHPEVSSLLVVSSATHLRRVRMCCRSLLPPQVHTLLAGVPNEDPFLQRDRWWRSRAARAMVVPEPIKLLVYRLALLFQNEIS